MLSEGPARPLSAKAASIITAPAAEAGQAVAQVARADHQNESLKQKAKSILSTKAGREQAAKVFEEGRLVEGSRTARKSKLETLAYFATEAGIDLFPLSSDTFGMLLGAMKLAGYRSADTYVSAARVRHIELRHPMSDELRQFLRSAERSMQRGVGQPKRAVTIDPIQLALSDCPNRWDAQTSHAHGPYAAWASFVVSVWWLLRGVETIALDLKNISKVEELGLAEIRLGATKTDIKGLGKLRGFVCICSVQGLPTSLCPSCQLRKVTVMRKVEGASDDDPLFVTPLGQRCTGQGLAKVWAMMCEVVDKCEDSGEVSLREVSEHTPRRTGTQFHIVRGLRLWQVQYIGRWGSATVEIYAAEASARINASWSTLVAKGIEGDLGVCADDPGAASSSVLPLG
jgi:hypothetical protein